MTHFLRLEEAVDELLISTARLRKRLYRAQTSYKNIVLETRMGLGRLAGLSKSITVFRHEMSESLSRHIQAYTDINIYSLFRTVFALHTRRRRNEINTKFFTRQGNR